MLADVKFFGGGEELFQEVASQESSDELSYAHTLAVPENGESVGRFRMNSRRTILPSWATKKSYALVAAATLFVAVVVCTIAFSKKVQVAMSAPRVMEKLAPAPPPAATCVGFSCPAGYNLVASATIVATPNVDSCCLATACAGHTCPTGMVTTPEAGFCTEAALGAEMAGKQEWEMKDICLAFANQCPRALDVVASRPRCSGVTGGSCTEADLGAVMAGRQESQMRGICQEFANRCPQASAVWKGRPRCGGVLAASYFRQSDALCCISASSPLATATPSPSPSAPCLGEVSMTGFGSGTVHVIEAATNTATTGVSVASSSSVQVTMAGRAYFGATCTAGSYSPSNYAAISLPGKTMRYTVNLAGSTCGCVATMYLVSMPQNTVAGTCGGDYYCDANALCGSNCAEVDIQEANGVMWKTTLHAASDAHGTNSNISGADYAPGSSCINTNLPFQVTAVFAADGDSIQTSIEQNGCVRSASVNYPGLGASITSMTPVVSYWSEPATGDMTWFDGTVCSTYDPSICASSVTYSAFSIETTR